MDPEMEYILRKIIREFDTTDETTGVVVTAKGVGAVIYINGTYYDIELSVNSIG